MFFMNFMVSGMACAESDARVDVHQSGATQGLRQLYGDPRFGGSDAPHRLGPERRAVDLQAVASGSAP